MLEKVSFPKRNTNCFTLAQAQPSSSHFYMVLGWALSLWAFKSPWAVA